ncbi:MAG: VRR-NUC domain-containing protein [Oscillospiraceae bacterium]|nr:VRR-NUC domain-containing protein [Oscillospiraceae bacterium]
MLEKEIEQSLKNAVKMRGGLALKFVSPGMNGVPDRLILFPGGKAAFAELKAPGRKMRSIQIKRKRQLEALGFSVYCIDGTDRIGGILDEINKG